jgi:hypothetical protein
VPIAPSTDILDRPAGELDGGGGGVGVREDVLEVPAGTSVLARGPGNLTFVSSRDNDLHHSVEGSMIDEIAVVILPIERDRGSGLILGR